MFCLRFGENSEALLREPIILGKEAYAASSVEGARFMRGWPSRLVECWDPVIQITCRTFRDDVRSFPLHHEGT